MIALPIMAEMNQSPHDQKNNATANMPDMLNVTSCKQYMMKSGSNTPQYLVTRQDGVNNTIFHLVGTRIPISICLCLSLFPSEDQEFILEMSLFARHENDPFA